MTEHSLRIVEGAEAARASILKRDADEATLPEQVRASILETFGQPLTAAEVDARLI